MNFYACIIATEILNGRRIDKHFEFLKNALAKYGHELTASFIIKDNEELIKNIYTLIKNDKKSVMFSFGGIGSTPDDLTRAIAAEVFTSKPLQRHKKFEQDIVDRFGDEAYPHRIYMSDLPVDSSLLFNPVNNMSGFSLKNRYFFVPGFPQMAHPMISAAIEEFFSEPDEKYRLTLLAQTSENTLVSVMKEIPSDIELSSLPILGEDKVSVEISLCASDKSHVQNNFNLFTKYLNELKIPYSLI
ncbi:MAG: molybdopterin-binding protein [Sulfurimonas sp.]|uniref:competence/damage-inducible protein A n=1 Tax=Sulfurimonas sp. TaxID=2022749 RepID=UPI002624048C|nr:molybdopterin-binding protein [Sulfurimonas sp.]MCW8895126.1 molybdopterin-binding protein [Sulfurimonas sp.]MCW8954366.1 molybdopterin-binding protein [Sulfurimonas sp.]MCW9068100.1 molybdopterin-binding protein [Sulfurimonas sp.]